MNKHSGFLGTYFNKGTVMRLAQGSRILAWVILVIYGLQLLLSAGVMALQVLRGFWGGMGLTDYAQNLLFLFEQPLRGVVYFVVLQGVAQVLLVFMDIEDNTRRLARSMERNGPEA
ncbi:MAG: hypothetical protein JXB85_16150 [Anaerolineales bacterium]|nr:hypothetical protein [Anaerolineales bacterium]